MKAIVRIEKEVDVRFIKVCAEVRYWEDATVNGVEDVDGTLIPMRSDNAWCPTIDLESGTILNWPAGTVAQVHYKVCDAGTYTLLDANRVPVLMRDGYVPDEFLCHGDNGYGDYIVMSIDENGKILDYSEPEVMPEDWEAVK